MKLLYMDASILKDITLFNRGMELISADRRNRIMNLKNPEVARLSLATGLLLRIALERSGLLFRLNEIQYEKHGKPYIDAENFYFSLSHSETYAICAYSNNDLGVDLQKIKPALPKSTQKILSVDEKEYLLTLNEKEHVAFFYRVWSMKESLIKWDGRGLRLPLTELSFIQGKKIVDSLIFEKKTLFFTESELLFPDYALCICTEKKQTIKNIECIDSKFLTNY